MWGMLIYATKPATKKRPAVVLAGLVKPGREVCLRPPVTLIIPGNHFIDQV